MWNWLRLWLLFLSDARAPMTVRQALVVLFGRAVSRPTPVPSRVCHPGALRVEEAGGEQVRPERARSQLDISDPLRREDELRTRCPEAEPQHRPIRPIALHVLGVARRAEADAPRMRRAVLLALAQCASVTSAPRAVVDVAHGV